MSRKCILLLIGLVVVLACKKAAPQSSGAAQSSAAQSSEQVARAADGEFVSGEIAPGFEFANIDGKKFSPKDFQGKTVLLNFWATWCVPCVAEMPALERLYKTYRDKGFEVVAINVDPQENREAVKKFIADNGLTFPVLLDSEFTLPPTYNLTGFPESFFLGVKGEFLNFRDPATGRPGVRVVGDRPWDAPSFIAAVSELLPKK